MQIQVVIDCQDPAAQARFWAGALGFVLQPPPPGYASWEASLKAAGVPVDRWNDSNAVVDPDDRWPRIFFQRVREPRIVKNRVHLDVRVGADVPTEVQRLLRHGASEVRPYEGIGESWVVVRDPEGNELCVS